MAASTRCRSTAAHILLAPKYWQYPFSAIPRYWGPAIQSERGWEYTFFAFFSFGFSFPTYWQEPFPCHPQVPRIACRHALHASHALEPGISRAERRREYPILPPRTDSTLPLSSPGAGGKSHQIREGMRVLYFSAPLCW